MFKNRESYHCIIGFDRFQRPIYFIPLILCAPGFRVGLHKKEPSSFFRSWVKLPIPF